MYKITKQWSEDTTDYRGNFKMDHTFKRLIFRIFKISFFERIRVVHYPDRKRPTLFYLRAIGIDEKYSDTKIYMKLYRVFSYLFDKSIEIDDIQNSKFIKYTFISDLFTDAIRDKKLKSIGI